METNNIRETKTISLELPIQVQKYAEELKKVVNHPDTKLREWMVQGYKEMIAEEVIKILNQK